MGLFAAAQGFCGDSMQDRRLVRPRARTTCTGTAAGPHCWRSVSETNRSRHRAIWRIHRDAYQGLYHDEPELNACYAVEFNYYGTSSGPTRIECPAGAVPITPPPLPKRDIPASYEPALKTVLGKLPERPSEDDVRAAIAAGLPKPEVDPETGLANVPPQVAVDVQGADVGVIVFARTGPESKDCMLAHRVGGKVKVWSLNQRDMNMEKPCTTRAALEAS